MVVFQAALPAAILYVVEVWTSNVRTKFTCVEWQHLTPVLFHGQLPLVLTEKIQTKATNHERRFTRLEGPTQA